MENKNLPKTIFTKKNLSEFIKKNVEDAEVITDTNSIKTNTEKSNEEIATSNNQEQIQPKITVEQKMIEALKSENLYQVDRVLKELEDKAENEPNYKKALNGVKLADKLNSKILGRVVYQNFKKIKPKKGNEFVNQIPNEHAFDATLESGFQSFVSWDKKKGNFYIESVNKLDKIIKEINKINPLSGMNTILDKKNPNQIIGKINNMTEEEFKSILLMGNDAHTSNKTKKQISSKSKENKKDNTVTKIKEEINPEIISQTEGETRRARIAELLKNQEERNEKILALEKEVERLRKILAQTQEQELKEN